MWWDELVGVKLTFSEFVLVGILCAILYGLSSLEIQSAQFNKTADDRQMADMRLATLSAFLGIPLSLICGVVAESGVLGHFSGLLALVPIIFIVAFWVKHHRFGSQLLDAEGLSKYTSDYYRNTVLTFIQTGSSSTEWLTEDQIYEGCSRNLVPQTALKMIAMTEAGKTLSVQMGIKELLDTLAFDRDKLRVILEALVANQLVREVAIQPGCLGYMFIDRLAPTDA
jgi:hypothetical protein